MKRRASFVISYLCILSLALIGLSQLLFADKAERRSERENRMLQGFPAFSMASLLDGSFAEDFEAYLSDSFFIRDAAADFSQAAMGLFSAEQEDTPMINLDEGNLAQMSEEDQAEMLWVMEAGSESPAESGGEDNAVTAYQTGDYSAATGASIWLERQSGSIETFQSYSAEEMATMAYVLDQYRACLPEDGTVHFISPPTSDMAFKAAQSGSYAGWGSDVDDVLQSLVGQGVYIYDATDILSPYLGQYTLYPTEDWHWHPVSASLVAAEMLRTQGVPATDYYEYNYYLPSRGRSYDRTALESLRISREEVPALEPVSPVESYVVTYLDQLRESVFITRNGVAYRQYLGGTSSPWRLFNTGYHTGRTALVIGDSFSNCFIPYLTPYYDQVLSTDFRDGIYTAISAGANARTYMEHYSVDDVYVVFCTLTSISGKMAQDEMLRYLNLDYSEASS